MILIVIISLSINAENSHQLECRYEDADNFSHNWMDNCKGDMCTGRNSYYKLRTLFQIIMEEIEKLTGDMNSLKKPKAFDFCRRGALYRKVRYVIY